MILEIRHYRLKPGRREAFIAFFEAENRAALRDAGMLVLGPMRDLEHPDKVHWIRAFPSLESREEAKAAFYSGEVWKERIGPMAMEMIENFEFELVETTDGFEGFAGERF